MHTHTLNIIKDLRLAPKDVYYSFIVHVGLQRQKVHITSIIVIRLQRKCSISTTKGFPSPINKQEEGTIPHCPVHLYVHDKISIPNEFQEDDSDFPTLNMNLNLEYHFLLRHVSETKMLEVWLFTRTSRRCALCCRTCSLLI